MCWRRTSASKVGDKVALLVQAADGSMGAQKFTVVGLVDPGMVELNNSLILMHLGDATGAAQLWLGGERNHRAGG